jgi:hypothetical protein
VELVEAAGLEEVVSVVVSKLQLVRIDFSNQIDHNKIADKQHL